MLVELFRLIRNVTGFTDSPYVMPYPIELAESMANCFPGPVIVIDSEEERIRWASPGALHFLGIPVQNARQLSVKAFLQEYFQPYQELLTLYEKRAAEGTYAAWAKTPKDSRYIVGIWTALRGKDTTPTRFMMIFQDATELELARQEILQYAEELRQQLETASALLTEKDNLLQLLNEKNRRLRLLERAFHRGVGLEYLIDASGKVIFQSRLRGDQSEYSTEQRDLTIHELTDIAYYTTDDRRTHLTFLLDEVEKAPFTKDVFFPRLGQGKWCSLSVIPVEEEDALYYHIILHDIHDIKRRELALEEQLAGLSASLEYAARIQRQFLSDLALCRKFFSDISAVYVPEGKVSGDFYHLAEVEGGLIFVMGDIMGHGVAAALVGMYLQALVREGIEQHGTGLENLYAYLAERLSVGGKEVGADIALLWWDASHMTLHYLGAGRPLWLLRQGEIYELFPSKKGLQEHIPPLQTLRLFPGDRLFLFSDGITDQLDPHGKRFGSGKLRNFILNIGATHRLDEIPSLLEAELRQWQQSEPQTDDWLFIVVEV